MTEKIIVYQANNLVANLIRSRHRDFTLSFLIDNGKVMDLPVASIKYIEPIGSICVFYMDNYQRGKFLIAQTISECEEQLIDYGFLRIHRKTLINLSCFQILENGGIRLKCGKELPIARRRIPEIKQCLADFDLL